jgi:LytS/YehU family sensor histidine kinase
VNYNFLPPGKYVFHVMGTTGAMIWSEPVSFTIEILPPFWRRWWFILGSVILLFSVASLILISYTRQQREKRKRLESELATLRAQLNPHFIFNSLSSLQNFITENQQLLALEYLSKFATLIRMILHNSQHAFIRLSEEIRFLELYTYMEAERYRNNVRFQIHVAPGLDTDRLKIPPMIVQPLIENSIKHGLLGTRPGKVDIYFSADANFLYCRIEDNGVGLAQAEENKKERTLSFPSVSTGLIRERIEDLKDRKGNRGGLRITDIIRDGKVAGVRAELTIPQHLEIHKKIMA